ncbi:MAG: hypothetical protein K0S51_1237 [Bacillales bacterium]|jgi:hypothetical protein|nr:hypothetical protein [Bacillales bacterium]
MKLQFAPIKFQSALAAGGISLMAFNYLQFSLPHGGGLINFFNINWSDLSLIQDATYMLLIVIMFLFSSINLILIGILLYGFVMWLKTKSKLKEFLENPLMNISIFVPIASIAMTINVIWGPLAFFIPNISIQKMMMPSLVLFGLLLISLLILEFKVTKILFTNPIDINKMNFVWLLDVFAIGLVSLTGTGIAYMSENNFISTIASVASLFLICIGIIMFITKLFLLIFVQFRNGNLPDNAVLPAYLLVIPITCLLGLSFYRILLYLEGVYSFKLNISLYLIINLSYLITIGWGIFTIYLIFDYLRKDFYKSQFSPTQWSMV